MAEEVVVEEAPSLTPGQLEVVMAGGADPLVAPPGTSVTISDCPSVKYVDVGPLMVKTVRGEIRALAGDVIIAVEGETPEDADENFVPPQLLWVLPAEFAGSPNVDISQTPPAEEPPATP